MLIVEEIFYCSFDKEINTTFKDIVPGVYHSQIPLIISTIDEYSMSIPRMKNI